MRPMSMWSKCRGYARQRLDNLGVRVARADALLHLALLGILTGLVSGGVILALRWLIETSQAAFLPGGGTENYEDLARHVQFLLPIGGALLIGLLFHLTSKGNYVTGVVQLLERMAYHQGHFSLRSLLLQFFGAAIALISGQSMGREGPCVQLGGASGSLVGQKLGLPNNAIRTLVGCGVAAAIGASFNTPLAGVIFSLEVVMMEYTLASFTPVILAAVSATAVSRLVYGDDPAFIIPPLHYGSLAELPVVLVLGIVVGCCAAALIHAVEGIGVRARALPSGCACWLPAQ